MMVMSSMQTEGLPHAAVGSGHKCAVDSLRVTSSHRSTRQSCMPSTAQSQAQNSTTVPAKMMVQDGNSYHALYTAQRCKHSCSPLIAAHVSKKMPS